MQQEAESKTVRVWVVRGGKDGQADELFLKNSVIAIGWPEMGDLSNLPPELTEFRNRASEKYPGVAPYQRAAMIYKFMHVIKQGDIILYPSKVDKLIHVGEVVGDYLYQAITTTIDFPHQRKVKWIVNRKRGLLGIGALGEIGAIQTLFEIKRNRRAFLALIPQSNLSH